MNTDISWWSVNEFVQPYIAAASPFPRAGTPAWDALPDDHPKKWAALLDAAQHDVLRSQSYCPGFPRRRPGHVA